MTLKADSTRAASSHPCPTCNGVGVVDFFDLVRGRAELHCRSCPTTWAEQTEATMTHLAAANRN